ncbi:hypothetical protein BH09PAT2_BH09PAT2_07600 [soil metagenome]
MHQMAIEHGEVTKILTSPLSTFNLDQFHKYPEWDSEDLLLWNPTHDRFYQCVLKDNSSELRTISLYGTIQGKLKEFMTVGENVTDFQHPFSYVRVAILEANNSGNNYVLDSHMIYSTKEPKWQYNWSGKIDGRFSEIEDEWKALCLSLVHFDELPLEVDIETTMQSFLQNMQNGDFTVPQIVIKETLHDGKG